MIRIAEARSLSGAFQLTLFLGEDYLGEAHVGIEQLYGGKPVVQLWASGRYYSVQTPSGAQLTQGNAWTLAALATQRAPQVAQQKVLYIGQAYGRPDADGVPTRNTFLRTQEHKKIQRIGHEYLGSDSDIFLTPLWAKPQIMWTSDDFVDDDQEGPDLEKLTEFLAPKSAGLRVALAEHALIAYFKPQYNEKLLDWGQPLTAPAQAMSETGLRVLNVTITNWNGVSLFYTAHAKARLSHRASFVIGHSEDQLDSLPYHQPGDVRGGLDLYMDTIDDSEPEGLQFGPSNFINSPLPSEQQIAQRLGSGRDHRSKVKTRRWFREMVIKLNTDDGETEEKYRQIKILHPERQEAFREFMTKVEVALGVVVDQQSSDPSMDRREACAALRWRTRDAQMVLATKFTKVAPEVVPVASQLIYDFYNLVELGEDPRISWSNPLVDHLHGHVHAVQRVLGEALISDKITPPERPDGWQKKVFAVTAGPLPEIQFIDLPAGEVATGLWGPVDLPVDAE